MSRDAAAPRVVLRRLLLKFVFAAIIALVMGPYLKAALSSVLNRSGANASAQPSHSALVQLPVHQVTRNSIPAVAPIEPAGANIEIRESQRKADEAMRILEANTPEM